jgi:hypothetical protein
VRFENHTSDDIKGFLLFGANDSSSTFLSHHLEQVLARLMAWQVRTARRAKGVR